MKKLIIALTLLLAAIMPANAFNHKTDSLSASTYVEECPIHVRMWAGDFYMFALDDYTRITLYDADGRRLRTWYIGKLADNQCTAWPSISFSDWMAGEYIIKLTGRGGKKFLCVATKTDKSFDIAYKPSKNGRIVVL